MSLLKQTFPIKRHLSVFANAVNWLMQFYMYSKNSHNLISLCMENRSVPLLLDGQVLLRILLTQTVRVGVQECQPLSLGVAGVIQIVMGAFLELPSK
jgi:hypothetical protein